MSDKEITSKGSPAGVQEGSDVETSGAPKADTSAEASQSKQTTVGKDGKEKRTRTPRPFPTSSFEDSLAFAKSLIEYGAGQAVRRISLFDHLDKSPESSASRTMVTNANKYGLIEGGSAAETLKPTEDGLLAVSEDAQWADRMRVRIRLTVESIIVFKNLYDKYVNNKLPARSALIDTVKDNGISAELAEEAVDTFVVNLRFLGLLQTLSGADRIVTVEHLIESAPAHEARPLQNNESQIASAVGTTTVVGRSTIVVNLDQVCFYVAPIGEDGSETRKHSDMILGSIVEPALEQFKLEVIRADEIASPGLIGKQIIEYIFGAKLIVADLSFHNPNVFYELAIRHMLRKPIVQIMRKANSIPFDINQQRTIIFDTTDIYSFVPKIETYRAEVSTQVRHALENADSADNPISFVFPSLKFVTGK